MSFQKCRWCRAYCQVQKFDNYGREELGECRKYAPGPNGFPKVKPDSFCLEGEFVDPREDWMYKNEPVL